MHNYPLWQVTKARAPLAGVAPEQFEDSLERLWRFILLHQGTELEAPTRQLVAAYLLAHTTLHRQTGTYKTAFDFLVKCVTGSPHTPRQVELVDVVPRYVRIAQNDPHLFQAVRESLQPSPKTFALRYTLWLIQTLLKEEYHGTMSVPG